MATIIRIITMGIIIIVEAGIMVTTVTGSGHSRRSENRASVRWAQIEGYRQPRQVALRAAMRSSPHLQAQ